MLYILDKIWKKKFNIHMESIIYQSNNRLSSDVYQNNRLSFRWKKTIFLYTKRKYFFCGIIPLTRKRICCMNQNSEMYERSCLDVEREKIRRIPRNNFIRDDVAWFFVECLTFKRSNKTHNKRCEKIQKGFPGFFITKLADDFFRVCRKNKVQRQRQKRFITTRGTTFSSIGSC